MAKTLGIKHMFAIGQESDPDKGRHLRCLQVAVYNKCLSYHHRQLQSQLMEICAVLSMEPKQLLSSPKNRY